MATYHAPIREMQFVLHELLDVEARFAELEGFEEATRDLIDPVLEEAGKLCESVIFPTNRTGDQEGCRHEDGEVHTPTGFREAYRAFVDGGWGGLPCDPEYGGQGLPHTLSVFVEEMMQSANMAFSLYPGLTHGAYLSIAKHGSEALRKKFLPRLVEGNWTGVMCLTESHCGTDLGLLRTRAEPVEGDAYRINGTKIFITGGEQDLTENIIHLVLARLPDAPAGVKGISMFLVPKFLVNDDGSLGARNAVSCGSIEHKMGIKGASTCVMNYEGAVGYLVGEPHRGLNAMFSMMNHERIMVGQQGLSLAEVAYQSAADYARDRTQGRSLTGPKAPDQAADPIIVHPDVRRMLLTTRAYNEGARALLGWVSLQIDRADRHPDPDTRQAADDAVMLLTPVVKAFFTDYGFEACNQCMQVFGGHGYIAEWGMEQLVRDARIAQIYEGANGIHALDLTARKLPAHGGRLVRGYRESIERFIADRRGRTDLAEFIGPLDRAFGAFDKATDWVLEAAASNPDEAGAASYDYLKLLGLVAIGRMWVEMAEIALASRDGDNSGFYDAKLVTARFFVRRLLPQASTLLESLSSGADDLMSMPAEAF